VRNRYPSAIDVQIPCHIITLERLPVLDHQLSVGALPLSTPFFCVGKGIISATRYILPALKAIGFSTSARQSILGPSMMAL
jgi:hypothetical protein